MRRTIAAFIVLALAACTPRPAATPAPAAGPEPAGPFDGLFAPPPAGEWFQHVSSYDTTGGNADMRAIAPGDSLVLLDLDGPGVIRRLWITVASRDPHYLRRMALRFSWEGETNPSIDVPLGDFFGDGFHKTPYASLPMGITSGGLFCYLPMPFARHARIVAVNGTGRRVDAFYYNIEVERGARLPEPVATLHAFWNREPRTTSHTPHLIVDAHGTGRFIGMAYAVQSLNRELWFLEGDEIYHVDGAFRGQGTGTEDYFNSGWYFDQGPFAAPFHGLIEKDDSTGRIVAYRWQIPDAVPFHDSIRVAIEHGTENTEVADYTTTGWWYQTEPHAPMPALPAPDARRVLGVIVPPDAIPGDSLRPAPGGGWLASVPRADRYRIIVYMKSHDPEDPGAVLPPVALDTVAASGSVVVRVPGDTSRPAAVRLVPVRRWAMHWQVAGPYPSPAVGVRGGVEYSPALDSVWAPERGDTGVAWKPATAGSDGRVNLDALFRPNDWVAAYARGWLYAPAARDVTLLLGADDAHQLWVNGALVSRRLGRHTSEPDDVAVPVRLHAGWNAVLIKVADLDGGWAFMLRAADPAGDLTWSDRPGTP